MAAETDFYRDVYPVLKANCISCHNKTTTKADLNMETPALVRKGGETGPGVIPGKSADSLVVQAAAHIGDEEMPPKNNKTGAKNLTPAELAMLKAWVDQGAKDSVMQARQVVWQPLPPGVNPIYTVAMTRDGRYAACARANQIFLYDIALRKMVTRVAGKDGVAHHPIVESLAFSPDGTRLASGSFREVKVWRKEKANVIARKKSDGAPSALLSILSADGKQMVCADKSGALTILDAVSGKLRKTIPAVNASGIKLLSLTPDASKAAVYGADATLSLWNLQEGKVIATQPGMKGLRTLAWARTGTAVAAAGDDKIVRVWSLPAPNTSLATPKGLKGATGSIGVIEAAANPDQLLTASDDGKVRIWSVSEAKVIKEFALPGVAALASSPDGKQFAAGGADGGVRVWDVEQAVQLAELRGDIESGKRLASLDWTAAAQGLEIDFHTKEVTRIETQNKALDELAKKANDTIAAVKKELPDKQKAAKPTTDAKLAAQKEVDEIAAQIAKAPDGKPDAALEQKDKEAQEKLTAAIMAETSALAVVEAAEHHITDAETEIKHITDSKAKNATAIKTANAAIATAKQLQTKAATDLAAAKQIMAKGGTRPVALAFSADGQSIAALGSDGLQRVWAIASGQPIAQAPVSAPTSGGSIVASGTENFLACDASGAVASVDLSARWTLERVIGAYDSGASPFVDRVNAVRFSPDGKMLAAGGGEPSRSGDISLWEVATGKPLKTWRERHSDAVLCLDFSPDGKLLASGAADKIARVTDVATGKQVQVFEGHTHYVMGIAFRADGRELATSGGDNVVLVWDMILGERKKKIEGWTKEVTSLQFIGATPQIVTSAGDNMVRIVSDEGAEVRAMAKLPDFMESVASASTGGLIVGGGEDSILRVWDGMNGKEVAVFDMKQ